MKNNNHLRKDLTLTESIIYRLEPDFVLRLQKDYPDFTEDEIKICVLMKNSFTENEISQYMSLTGDETLVAIKNLSKKLKQNYNKELKHIFKTN